MKLRLPNLRFYAKKISVTLLSVIMRVICSIQNSDVPKLISELLFLNEAMN